MQRKTRLTIVVLTHKGDEVQNIEILLSGVENEEVFTFYFSFFSLNS